MNKNPFLKENKKENDKPLWIVAIGCLVLVLLIAVGSTLVTLLPTYDSKYGNYDSTGEEYDIYLPDYISVCNYSKLKLPNLSHTVTQQDIDNKLVYYKALYCDSIYDADRGAEYYDSIAINSTCKFTDDGSTYSTLTFKEGSNGWGQAFILGINNFYTTELDDAIVGMKAGETKTVTFNLPDPYYVDIANSGREVEMEITLVYIDEIAYDQADEVDEETGEDFYTENYGYSEELFLQKIESDLQDDYDEMLENYKPLLAYNYLMQNSTVKEMPEEIYNEKYEQTVDTARATAQGKDLTLLEYVNTLGYETLDDYYAYVKSTTEESIKFDMICYYIIRCEGLTLTDDYYNDKILELASSDYYTFTDTEEAEDYLDSLYGLDYVKEELLKEYAIEWVGENATVVDDVNTVYDNNLGLVPAWKNN